MISPAVEWLEQQPLPRDPYYESDSYTPPGLFSIKEDATPIFHMPKYGPLSYHDHDLIPDHFLSRHP